MIIVHLKSKEPGPSYHVRDVKVEPKVEPINWAWADLLFTHAQISSASSQRAKNQEEGSTYSAQLVDPQGELADRITTDKGRQSIANVPFMSSSKSTARDYLLVA